MFVLRKSHYYLNGNLTQKNLQDVVENARRQLVKITDPDHKKTFEGAIELAERICQLIAENVTNPNNTNNNPEPKVPTPKKPGKG